MPLSDRELGLPSSISRRDFLNGSALAVGAAVAGNSGAMASDAAYPPALTGMRGHRKGSFEAMHAMRDGEFFTGEETETDTKENYDLIVVGAGISGLRELLGVKKHAPSFADFPGPPRDKIGL